MVDAFFVYGVFCAFFSLSFMMKIFMPFLVFANISLSEREREREREQLSLILCQGLSVFNAASSWCNGWLVSHDLSFLVIFTCSVFLRREFFTEGYDKLTSD